MPRDAFVQLKEECFAMKPAAWTRIDLEAWERNVRWQHQLLTRRRELLSPRYEHQYLSSLMWMAACGEERDIKLLDEARRLDPFPSKRADALIREATFRIAERSARKASDAGSRERSSAAAEFAGPFGKILAEAADASAEEATARRIDLMRPSDEEAWLRALYWADACGEELDLELLVEIKGSPPFHGDGPVLIETAMSSIRRRLHARKLLHDLFINEKGVLANDVLRLGVSTRGTSARRGTLTRASEGRAFGDDDQGARAIEMLQSPDPELRNQVALVLGEWGGEEEAETLAEAMKREGWETSEGEQFALHCIAGLKNIGGPVAVRTLCEAVVGGTVAIQLTALNAIEDLATGGSEVFGEGAPHFDPPRGRYYQGKPPARGTEEITKILEKAMNEAESPAVRERSKELLHHVLV